PADRARGDRPGRRRRRAAAWRSPSARSKNPPVAEIEGDGDVRADGEDEEHRQRSVEEPPPAHDPLEAVVERDLHPHLLEPEVAAPELDEVVVVLEMEARAEHAEAVAEPEKRQLEEQPDQRPAAGRRRGLLEDRMEPLRVVGG